MRYVDKAIWCGHVDAVFLGDNETTGRFLDYAKTSFAETKHSLACEQDKLHYGGRVQGSQSRCGLTSNRVAEPQINVLPYGKVRKARNRYCAPLKVECSYRNERVAFSFVQKLYSVSNMLCTGTEDADI